MRGGEGHARQLRPDYTSCGAAAPVAEGVGPQRSAPPLKKRKDKEEKKRKWKEREREREREKEEDNRN